MVTSAGSLSMGSPFPAHSCTSELQGVRLWDSDKVFTSSSLSLSCHNWSAASMDWHLPHLSLHPDAPHGRSPFSVPTIHPPPYLPPHSRFSAVMALSPLPAEHTPNSVQAPRFLGWYQLPRPLPRPLASPGRALWAGSSAPASGPSHVDFSLSGMCVSFSHPPRPS